MVLRFIFSSTPIHSSLAFSIAVFNIKTDLCLDMWFLLFSVSIQQPCESRSTILG